MPTQETIKAIEERVSRIFREHRFHYEWYVQHDSRLLHVPVHVGDWKHDHLHLDYVMAAEGFHIVSTTPFGEPTMDDTYSATHVYSFI